MGEIIYVNQAVTQSSNDGLAWSSAYLDLKDALNRAANGDQIWVARGVYKPGSNRNDSFRLNTDGVEIYGGFVGVETERDERDWRLNTTTLSGVISQSGDTSVNNYHVVICDNISQTTVLDGFYVTGGNGNGNQFPESAAGGIYCKGRGEDNRCSPTLQNLVIYGNRAKLGSAMYIDGTSNGESSPHLNNIVFSGNEASTNGGALLCNGSTSGTCRPTLTNIVFSGNRAQDSGGAIFSLSCSPIFNNITVSGNKAGKKGGGIYFSKGNGDSSPTLNNIILWNNKADEEGDQIHNENVSPRIANGLVQGGIASIPGTTGNALSGEPRFNEPVDPEDAPTMKGDLRLRPDSAGREKVLSESFPSDVMTDPNGRPRLVNGKADFGAYQPFNIIYVNSTTESNSPNGRTWRSAYTDLQDALDGATVGNEIWVAKGIYKPTTETGREARKKSFVLVEGVEIYGGFTGREKSLTERNWEKNKTILSGNIGVTSNDNNNSYHVVTGQRLSRATILDGFTITGGRANGGGRYLSSNYFNGGGGLYLDGRGEGNFCNPTLRNLIVSGNQSSGGGAGMFANGTRKGQCNVTLVNVIFSGNKSLDEGGAVICYSIMEGVSNPRFVNVTISGNYANTFGGGVYNNGGSGTCRPIFTNVIIWDNWARSNGHSMGNRKATPIITNSIIEGGLTINRDNRGVQVESSTITDWGGNLHADPNFVSEVDPNEAPKNGGNFRLRVGSAALNSGDGRVGSGSAALDLSGRPRMRNGQINIGAYEGCILYVDQLASEGEQDGTSWNNAYTDLQEALYAANKGDEIWVARGTYKPGSNRDDSFTLNTDGVEVYGGFVGVETEREQRNWHLNTTTLSGDLGQMGDTTENSLHVVTCKGVSRTTILDGFYITGGNGDGKQFPQNTGGGLYCDGRDEGNDASPTLRNLTFYRNRANYGSGMYINGSDSGESRPLLINVVFRGNKAIYDGGAIYCNGVRNGSCRPVFINVVFSGNRAGRNGGAIYNTGGNNGFSHLTITNVTFSGNKADELGGAIYNNGRDGRNTSTLTNVILWNNKADENGDQIYNRDASQDISYSIVQGEANTITGATAGWYCYNGNPKFVRPVNPNDAPTLEGDLRLSSRSSGIDRGDVSALPTHITNDPNGRLRIISDKVDIGAYTSYKVIFVNANRTRQGDGRAWWTAYQNLQNALESATFGHEIWVAQGTYIPTTETGSGAREKSFVLKDGVEIYGGFNGKEESLAERDWQTNQTILSGQLSGGQNSYHVVSGTELSPHTILDGFTITDGKADGDPFPHYLGGGVSLIAKGIEGECSPTLRNLTFTNNHAQTGAGFYIYGQVDGKSQPTLINIRFSGNQATESGGGMFVYGEHGASNPTLINVSFAGNKANKNGGGIKFYRSSSPLLLNNVTLNGNKAGNDGGGIAIKESSVRMINGILWNNQAGSDGKEAYIENGQLTISNTIYRVGGLIRTSRAETTELGENYQDDPAFVDSVDPNDAPTLAGDLRLLPHSPAIGKGDNRAVPFAISADLSGVPRINNHIVDIGAYEFNQVIFVDPSAGRGTKDGLSWDNAYIDLRVALAKAKAGDEIWVAKGVYKPTKGTNRDISFVLKDKVQLYGGFSGTEKFRNERDWIRNKTILSGEISYYDDKQSNSSCHVITGKNLTPETVLDGFIISGGRAAAMKESAKRGGGLVLDGSGQNNDCSPTLRNLIFAGNLASGRGGAIYMNGSSQGKCNPTVTNVVFSGNKTYGGGGAVYCNGSLYGECSPVFTNVTFTGNSALDDGGAVYVYGYSGTAAPTFTNVIFWDNDADRSKGEVMRIYYGNPTFSNCIIQGGLSGGNSVISSENTWQNTGTGNLQVNPNFVGPINPASTPTIAGNFRLCAASPALGTGDNGVDLEMTQVGLSGGPRKVGGKINIGAYEGCVIFVNQAVTGGTSDGSSWANALADLQAALGKAQVGDEIWVAAGTYTPPADTASTGFVLVEGVRLYGGFAGHETAQEQRDWQGNITTLSGGNSTAMQQVVTADKVTQATVLDGFHIADSTSNGLSLISDPTCNPTLHNLIFSGGTAPLEANTARRGSLSVDDIEVTQAIQDVAHSVPLIKGKETFVRVYLTLSSDLVDQGGLLRGVLKLENTETQEISQILSEGFLGVLNANQESLRDKRFNANHSLNFRLPNKCLTGSYKLSLASCLWINNDEPAKLSVTSTERTVNITTNAPPLRLHIVGLKYEKDDVTSQPRPVDYALIESWLRRAYPIPSIEVSRVITDVQSSFYDPLDRKSGEAITQVAAMRSLDMGYASIDRRTHYYGLVIERTQIVDQQEKLVKCTFMKGEGQIPSKADPTAIATGPTGVPGGGRIENYKLDIDESYGDWYTAHELGHALGRNHAKSDDEGNPDESYPYTGAKIGDETKQFVGFDVGGKSKETLFHEIKPQALPYTDWHDVMSYADNQWLSDYTYKAILKRLQEEDELGADGTGGNNNTHGVKFAEGSFINVVGIRRRENGETKEFSIEFVNPVPKGFVPTSTPSDRFQLKFHIFNSAEGLSANQQNRTKVFPAREESSYIDILIKVADLNLAATETIKKIDLFEGNVTTTYVVPENASTIDDLSIPSNPQDGIKTVTWKSTGGNPFFNVQISQDDGTSWNTLAVGLTKKKFSILTAQFEGLGPVKLRIMATNGIEAIFSDAQLLWR